MYNAHLFLYYLWYFYIYSRMYISLCTNVVYVPVHACYWNCIAA